jgi:crotonobetainyl-CoA:carnitine CoA-transferase CaiB-like acyl-CoA transferase
MGAAIGQPDLIDDPRFVTSDVRARHWEELMALVETWTRRHSAAECEHIFMVAGLPASRYRTVREALNEPALRDSAALSAMGEDEHRHVVTGAPFRLSRTPPAAANWVADLDRDGEAIRAEFAARD